MKVAVIGSGGREHAIALTISKSKNLSELYCIPGNPGTKNFANNVQLNTNQSESIVQFSIDNQIDLVVIGPEQPLVDGLSDELRRNNIKVFGPSSEAAKIESSKSFAKKIMNEANVPTSKYREFTSSEIDDAKKYLSTCNFPIVIKADGLAAGKGVVICRDLDEALDNLFKITINKVFGDAGNKILVEEFLNGEEASVFAITDGKIFITLPAAQDHKRVGDNDTGKNTGGMGAYAPTPLITPELELVIQQKIIKPVIDQLNKAGIPFIGCLYAGLMITADGPKVIEFNCRFGDPETQVVLPLLDGDFLEILYSAAAGKLNSNAVKYNGGSAVCVVAASKGYPDRYEKGFQISGLDIEDPEIIIYHAGTVEKDGQIVTKGGRVLGITAVLRENNIRNARNKVYEVLKKIRFKNIYYRNDIALKA
ncbi:phosphoribosylamine--glycine ligase [Ignavibacterium sp.]|uniref:phosphoribosylamine--glycine ligase n=1 Tax=Ignavibacterium sp. TaxID=2651167 RepID=UPI00307DE2A6